MVALSVTVTPTLTRSTLDRKTGTCWAPSDAAAPMARRIDASPRVVTTALYTASHLGRAYNRGLER